MEDTVRWSLKVSRETDEALRAHLGRAGGRKGDLSRFVQGGGARAAAQGAARIGQGSAAARPGSREDLARALQDIRQSTRKLSKARFEKLVAEAVAYARARR